MITTAARAGKKALLSDTVVDVDKAEAEELLNGGFACPVKKSGEKNDKGEDIYIADYDKLKPRQDLGFDNSEAEAKIAADAAKVAGQPATGTTEPQTGNQGS